MHCQWPAVDVQINFVVLRVCVMAWFCCSSVFGFTGGILFPSWQRKGSEQMCHPCVHVICHIHVLIQMLHSYTLAWSFCAQGGESAFILCLKFLCLPHLVCEIFGLCYKWHSCHLCVAHVGFSTMYKFRLFSQKMEPTDWLQYRENLFVLKLFICSNCLWTKQCINFFFFFNVQSCRLIYS